MMKQVNLVCYWFIGSDRENGSGYYMFDFKATIENVAEKMEWYWAKSGSEMDCSKKLGLPEKIAKDKAGTPVAGYEELCALFNKAVETHAESIN